MSTIKTVLFADEETERLKKLFHTFKELGLKYVRIQPGKCVLPAAYEQYKDRYACWNVRPDDIYVLSFPKNGTTWTQELVWCIQNGCNLEEAKSVTLSERVPFLEYPVVLSAISHQVSSLQGDPVALMENMASPRIFKSHMPLCLLPNDLLDKCKVVSCLRNPKDTVVSYYHHAKLWKSQGFFGEFASYFDLFMDNMVLYGSYFDYVSELWKRKDHPNMCLLFFEDMKMNQADNIRKVAKFLQKELTEEQIEDLVDHLSFKKMKENKCVNLKNLQAIGVMNPVGSFMRKGEVGDWKNFFSEEMNKRMDAAIDKYFTPIGLEFKYE